MKFRTTPAPVSVRSSFVGVPVERDGARKMDTVITRYTALMRSRSLNLYQTCKQLCVIHMKKFSINKRLIPVRIALFLWYGAARIPITYLIDFLEQKGLSLEEYSSVLSTTFVFQFLTTFLSGIVADKIGNVKPVLMFHILFTTLTMLAFILTPTINVSDSFPDNTPSYEGENISNITGNYENITEIWQNELVSKVISNECNVLKNKSYTEDPSLNVTDLLFGDSTENSTVLSVEALENKCGSHKRSFLILYVIAVAIFLSCLYSGYRFMDVTVMSLVEECGTSFGFERFFSILGDAAITFIAGIVLSTFTSAGKENNYQSVFWLSVCMLCLVLIAVYNINTEVKPPIRNIWKKAFSLISNTEIAVFIIVIFTLGTFSCLFDYFIVPFLEYLNASTVVIGLQQAISPFYGLLFVLTFNRWLKVFGTEIIFLASYVGYIIYGLGYSFLHEPWWSLLIEASSIFTYHLLWIAVVVHSHCIAPEELVSTVIATAGAIHWDLGRSAGGLTGGLIMSSVGPRVTFRIFAGMSSVAAILYATFLCCRR